MKLGKDTAMATWFLRNYTKRELAAPFLFLQAFFNNHHEVCLTSSVAPVKVEATRCLSLALIFWASMRRITGAHQNAIQ